MRYRIFISSVQREFAKERKALAEYIRRDALFGKFFDVFLFEEMPATNVSAQRVYLVEVKQCRSWGLADPEFKDGPDFRIVIRRQVDVNQSVNVPANVPANGEAESFLALVRNHPGKGTAFYAARLGKTRRTIKRYAAAVAELVEFRGGTKSGGYYIRTKEGDLCNR